MIFETGISRAHSLARGLHVARGHLNFPRMAMITTSRNRRRGWCIRWICHASKVREFERWLITLYHLNFSRWWFQMFSIITPTWGNDPIWLMFFKGVETTNQFFKDEDNCLIFFYNLTTRLGFRAKNRWPRISSWLGFQMPYAAVASCKARSLGVSELGLWDGCEWLLDSTPNRSDFTNMPDKINSAIPLDRLITCRFIPFHLTLTLSGQDRFEASNYRKFRVFSRHPLRLHFIPWSDTFSCLLSPTRCNMQVRARILESVLETFPSHFRTNLAVAEMLWGHLAYLAQVDKYYLLLLQFAELHIIHIETQFCKSWKIRWYQLDLKEPAWLF